MTRPHRQIATRWPSFSEEEANAVRDVILSNRVNFWTGEHCRLFEREFAEWCGANHAIALANGTLALEVALKALGIGPGDEVVVTPRSFIASVSCVIAAGASPVFADVDRDSQNITAETIAKVLTPRTKAIICVHLAGLPCDMDPILELGSKHGVFVIEDCAQAHGARYKGRSVGTMGHIGAWSFCQDKIMTTGGEGGMVTTNDTRLMSLMWSYKDHGKSLDAVTREHPPGFRWLHESFGSNFRMLEVQAVLGRLQLKKMDEWSAARQRNAMRIWETARKWPALRVPPVPRSTLHAAYRAYVFVDPLKLRPGQSRDALVEAFNQRGVPCLVGSCPEIYQEKAFDGTPWRPRERLEMAKELGETSLMFFVQPTLEDEELEYICWAIEDVMRHSTLE